MRVLVAGARGMLGQDLVLELARRNIDHVGFGHQEFDLLAPADLEAFANGKHGRFDWVVNCAAYTAVDKAESEPLAAHRLNAAAPGALAHACRLHGARMVHVSTDFVFDGRAKAPYTEAAPTHPLGVYGKSKREGEVQVLGNAPDALVCRTSWLYGPLGSSFPLTMIKAWKAGKSLRVVADQLGTPTYTADLARTLVDLAIAGAEPGVYHTAGPDIVSWHELALRAIRQYAEQTNSEAPVEIAPIASSDWPTPTPRPAFSALASDRLAALGIAPMRLLDTSLDEFVGRLLALES